MKHSLIVDFIKEQLAGGSIAAGAKLPSIRDLCVRFECTKTTVIRAYDKLKEQGVVYAIPGSGYYLVEQLVLEPKATSVIDFTGASLDKTTLPYNEFGPCIAQAISKHKEDLFACGNPQGLLSLRQELRRHLQSHQVFADTDRIMVTTGSQQALNILASMPFPNNRANVVIEQPTYQGMIRCLQHNRVATFGVNHSFAGPDFDALEKCFRHDNVKFFYVIPRFSNPLGSSYTNAEKKILLALAEKYNVYLVEDDYLADLENSPKATPIFSFDSSDRVIYIKTFSKVLLPGLRIAVVVLPRLLVNTFNEYKHWMDINTPLLSQGSLEIFLASGLFDVHVKRIRKIYAERMACLKELTDKAVSPAFQWHVPTSGSFYAGIEIRNHTTEKAVIEGLLRQKVRMSATEPCYLAPFYTGKTLRVSIAHTDIDQIKAGIPLVSREIRIGAKETAEHLWL